MLTSLIKCIKREGVEEIKWSEVLFLFLSSKFSYLKSPLTGGAPTLGLYQRTDGQRINPPTNTCGIQDGT